MLFCLLNADIQCRRKIANKVQLGKKAMNKGSFLAPGMGIAAVLGEELAMIAKQSGFRSGP